MYVQTSVYMYTYMYDIHMYDIECRGAYTEVDYGRGGE